MRQTCMLCLLLANSARDRAGSILHAVQLRSVLCNHSGRTPPGSAAIYACTEGHERDIATSTGGPWGMMPSS